MKFNRKHLTTLVATILLATLTHSASAFNFMVDGLCYNILSETKTVYVTYQKNASGNYNSLTSANIPSSVSYNGTTYSVVGIGYRAFHYCNNLKSVTIPNSVTYIGEEAFASCGSLSGINIPNSVKLIGPWSFQCTGLTSISIPNSIDTIASGAFAQCPNLVSVNIPNSVVFIGSSAFASCSALKDITIPNSVTGIGSYAFHGCKLSSITIPSSVTEIGANLFYDCTELKTVNWNVKNCRDFEYSSSSSLYSTSPFSKLQNITTFNFGNEVETIPAYLCYGLSGLTSVTIPNSVTSIGSGAFYNCSGLTSITIPNSVTAIRNSVFSGCSSLTNVTIPNSITEIGYSAFRNCSGLTSVTIPNSVTTIGYSAFENCTSLTNITIPSSVATIGDKVFSSCSGLKTVNWNVKSCSNFTSSTPPFNNITGIEEFIFGNEVERIPAYLCKGFASLTNITIPSSVTYIGNSAFYGCNGIKTLTWNAIQCGSMGNMPKSNIETVTIGNSVQLLPTSFVRGSKITSISFPTTLISIRDSAFYNCSYLTSANIPNSVTSIGGYAFYGCNNLINLTMPNSLVGIGRYAFEHCRGLTSIIIPKLVTSIGSGAFAYCSGLKYVLCRPTIPPSVSNGGNSYYNHDSFDRSTPIFVPADAMETYQKSSWQSFNIKCSMTKITPYMAHASVYSEDKEISHLVKVKLNNKEYSVSNDSIMIPGLQPNEQYSAVAICKVAGEDVNDTITFTTKSVQFESMLSSTQTTITPKFKVFRDVADFSFQSSGMKYNEQELTGSIMNEANNYYIVATASITGLNPNTNYSYFTPWIVCNGKRCEGQQYSITTKNIGTSSNAVTGPTNVEMTGSYNAGDATVKDAYFTFNGQQMKKIVMTGLRPSTTYSTVYTVVTNTGRTFNTNMSFKTKSLTMTTQAARMLTDTSPMLIAETNMADVETSCGFEWRRNDAPEEMPSTKVYCPVYGGTMAGVLKNMSPNVYYKYRPFYKASDGNEYYGNWIAFITADAGVTFEPVVYTYKAPEVTQNTATLQGVALPGSSEITEQGFEYWRMNGSKAPTGTVNKVTATGQRMSATVQGLNAGATYGYRSYVKAGGQTYYGSEEQFTTEKPTGDVNGDGRVNVSDVSALINMILGITPMEQTTGDVNGDGRVNVSDVSALINIILGIQ